jgi:hypothetical protein
MTITSLGDVSVTVMGTCGSPRAFQDAKVILAIGQIRELPLAFDLDGHRVSCLDAPEHLPEPLDGLDNRPIHGVNDVARLQAALDAGGIESPCRDDDPVPTRSPGMTP